MRVRQAKDVAREWVLREARGLPVFAGALTHGSVNWLADSAALPPASDLDVLVVLAGADTPGKGGKIAYGGVVLDVSYLPRERVEPPERVLGDYHLAGSFAKATILADPSGRLASLRAAVAGEYAQRRWVRARCEHARGRVLDNLRSLDETTLLHDRAMSWLFAAGITTHVLLVAGLRNPTVRRRYVAVRELLADYGRASFYPSLLELLGCAGMGRAQVEGHLAPLSEAFDAAKHVVKTPFPFAADIGDGGRHAAIDGSRALIERGDQREAVFWMAVTYSRCMKVLHDDAPELQERYEPGYRRLLGDLGITSAADLGRRGEEVRAFLPRLWGVAEVILGANPDIEHDLDPRA